MANRTAGVFEMESMILDGTWQAYVMSAANLYIFQCRDDTKNINVSHHSAGMGYFTIKVRQSLPLSCSTVDMGEDQTLYFRGDPASVLEILKQKKS